MIFLSSLLFRNLANDPCTFLVHWELFYFLSVLVIGIYLTVEKYFFEVYKMTERPLFYFGLFAMVIGSQLFVTGFLAEMISRNSSDRNVYQVEKEIGLNNVPSPNDNIREK